VSVVTKEMLDAAILIGRSQERERIIKLLEVSLKDYPDAFANYLISLIKGETK
jgi:hypothetical protein